MNRETSDTLEKGWLRHAWVAKRTFKPRLKPRLLRRAPTNTRHGRSRRAGSFDGGEMGISHSTSGKNSIAGSNEDLFERK